MVPVFYYANCNPYHPPTKLSYLNGKNNPIQPCLYIIASVFVKNLAILPASFRCFGCEPVFLGPGLRQENPGIQR
jgi:hypothetical protein